MRRQVSIPVLGILVLAAGIFGYSRYQKLSTQPTKITNFSAMPKIDMSFPSFNEGIIPLKNTCEGDDLSPSITFKNVPKNTKSLALVVDDLNATIGTFTHWLIWNIDPATRKITEGSPPAEATVGKNSFGNYGWAGPCPPAGSPHHYRFQVFALSNALDLLTETTTQNSFLKAINGQVLGHGEVTAIFGQ